MASFEADRILADLKRRLLKKMSEEELDLASSEYSSETVTTYAEDAAINAVELALPEERQRIRELLEKFPKQVETKVEKLIHALGTLWRQDAGERVVVFATYLGSVEMLGDRDREGVPRPGRRRPQGRRPRQQTRRREAVQAGERPEGDDLHGGGA